MRDRFSWSVLILAGVLFPDFYNHLVLPAVIGSHVFDARADWLLPVISINVWTVSSGLVFAGFVFACCEALSDLSRLLRLSVRKRRQARTA